MINFLKYKWFYFLISAVVIGSGLLSIFKWGFSYSIDFIGGTNLEYQIDRAIEIKTFKEFFEQKMINIFNIRQKDKVVQLRITPIDEKKERELRKDLEKKLKIKIVSLKFETVGPALGKETMVKTAVASLLAIGGILVYMSFAFKSFYFAVSAVAAMIHDFLVVVGSYSLLSHFLGAEIDTLFVTALLTTMSFSVHDTIVIFDKIREYWREEGKGEIEHFANKALTETMVRSLNNSMTIIFMLLALILLGGSTIRFFVVTLLIGTITGTYSSPFVATPILVWLEGRKR